MEDSQWKCVRCGEIFAYAEIARHLRRVHKVRSLAFADFSMVASGHV